MIFSNQPASQLEPGWLRSRWQRRKRRKCTRLNRNARLFVVSSQQYVSRGRLRVLGHHGRLAQRRILGIELNQLLFEFFELQFLGAVPHQTIPVNKMIGKLILLLLSSALRWEPQNILAAV